MSGGRKRTDQQKQRDAMAAARMALWNISGVLSLALDHSALEKPQFPDEVCAAMRLALGEAKRASDLVDRV